MVEKKIISRESSSSQKKANTWNTVANSKTERMRRLVRQVLRQLKERHPNDFKRLQRVLVKIKPVSATGTKLGECKLLPVDFNDPWFRIEAEDAQKRIIELVENIESDWKATAVIAHELGHGCAKSDDLDRRKAPCDDWDRELAADWYAYKWGFGRLIARERKTRNLFHHLVAPGREFEYDGIRYAVTRNFVCKQLD